MTFEQEIIAEVVARHKMSLNSERLRRMREGKVAIDNLRAEVVQMYFHTVGFVAGERAMYNRCFIPDLRQELAEGLYEEETGRISKTYPHLELYFRMADSWGLSREEISRHAYICPEMAAIVNWYAYAASFLPSVEALTVMNFCSEGQNATIEGLPGGSRLRSDALSQGYQKSGDGLLFYEVHDSADQEHFAIATRNLCSLVKTEEERDRIRCVIRITYDAWARYGAAVENLTLKDSWKGPASLLYR